MGSRRTVTVFGAYGHTGRFIVSELHKRGWRAILSGRNRAKFEALHRVYAELDVRDAPVEEPASLDRALAGASAVINCAGPFADTAIPVVEAALRAGIHYLDVAAEQPAILAIFERFAETARGAHVAVLPAMAFYGALGDLLATTAIKDWATADEISVAVALDSWRPTNGTRLTGQRNSGQHLIFSDNRLQRADPPRHKWNSPSPFGTQEVVGLPLAENHHDLAPSTYSRDPQLHQ